MEEDETILKQNSAVSPNRRRSLAEKLKLIKYVKETFAQYLITMEFLEPTIRFSIKEKEELMQLTKNENCYIP